MEYSYSYLYSYILKYLFQYLALLSEIYEYMYLYLLKYCDKKPCTHEYITSATEYLLNFNQIGKKLLFSQALPHLFFLDLKKKWPHLFFSDAKIKILAFYA